MKQEWKRIVEVLGRGSEGPAGLEYQYPCGHTFFLSHERILEGLAAGDGEVVTAPVLCPECPEGSAESTDPVAEEILKELNPNG